MQEDESGDESSNNKQENDSKIAVENAFYEAQDLEVGAYSASSSVRSMSQYVCIYAFLTLFSSSCRSSDRKPAGSLQTVPTSS